MLCRRALHDLDDPANVWVQPSNGVRHCLPCKRARARGELEPATHCRAGLHDLTDPANVYVQPSTQKPCCLPCMLARAARTRARRAAGVAA